MDKRQHIIQKAIELFSEGGFDNTSIRDISQKACVNVAMVNYYFGTKKKLFEAIIEFKSTYLKTRLSELLTDTSIDEMEKINVIIEEYATRILSNPHFHRVMHQELLLNTRPEMNDSIKKLFSNNYQIIRKIIEEGIRKNIFRQVDIDLTVSTLFGTINHYMQTSAFYVEPGGEESPALQNDESLRKRLVNHLQQLMQAHLLKDKIFLKQ
jgi:AcrR family transcriptional regulator